MVWVVRVLISFRGFESQVVVYSAARNEQSKENIKNEKNKTMKTLSQENNNNSEREREKEKKKKNHKQKFVNF